MMTRAASKRARISPGPDVPDVLPPFIPFQTGPGLQCIPDDVLLEIVSHLPTLDDAWFKCPSRHVVPSTVLVRTPTLRALSQTSRLLRARCLAMAWQNIELCGDKIQRVMSFYSYDGFGVATEIAIRVLEACPYLLPFIQTVSVILTRYQYTKVIPDLAACLATLPNLSTIRVSYAQYRLKTTIRNAFRGVRLPSVRRIFLPCGANEIIRSCRNVEEVTCFDEYHDGSAIIQSLVESKCYNVRIIKGVSAPLTRLVTIAPKLTYASIEMTSDMTPLASFPFLDTIEILVRYMYRFNGQSLCQIATSAIEKGKEILKGNSLQAEKTLIVAPLNDSWDQSNPVTTVIIKV